LIDDTLSDENNTELTNLTDKYEDLVEKILSYIPKKSENIPVLKRFQSLSIDVPGMCPNSCKYCVSAMHSEDL